MKLLLIAGHGGTPFDPGATGNGVREADLTRDFANRLVLKCRIWAWILIYMIQLKIWYRRIKTVVHFHFRLMICVWKFISMRPRLYPQ